METEYYAGIPVDVVTYEMILKELPEWFKSNEQKRLTSINPQIISLAAKHPDILTYIETSDCRFPDGIGIVALSKWLGGEIKERVTGIELMIFFSVMRLAIKKGLPLWLTTGDCQTGY